MQTDSEPAIAIAAKRLTPSQLMVRTGLAFVAFDVFAFLELLCSISAGYPVGELAEITAWRNDRRPIQFTLRQMFVWTTIVAVFAALCRLLDPILPALSQFGLVQDVIYGGLMVATLAATLGSKHYLWRLGFCALAAYCASMAFLFIWFRTPEIRSLIKSNDLWPAKRTLPVEIANENAAAAIPCVAIPIRSGCHELGGRTFG